MSSESLPFAEDLTENDKTICLNLSRWFDEQEWTTATIGQIKDQKAWKKKADELYASLDIVKTVRHS